MEVVCPSCKFKGNIQGESIPDSGREITCPRCKNKFFVRKKETEKPKSEMVGNVVSEPPRKSIRPNVSNIREESITKKPIFVCSSLLVTAVAFFVFGIIVGAALFYSDSEPNTEISRSENMTKSPSETPSSAEEEDNSPKTLFSTEGKVDVYELIKNLLPLSEMQIEKYIEDNHNLTVYGTGDVEDVQKIDIFWEAMFKSSSGENKYGVVIKLDGLFRRVNIGLDMNESDVMKINRGEKVKFNGELINFINHGSGLELIYLYDGKVVKY